MEILLRIGDLTGEEIRERCEGDAETMIRTLEEDGRAVRVEFHDGPRWIAAEESGTYGSLDSERSAEFLIGRLLQSHGPVTSSEIGLRFGTDTERAERIARRLADDA